MRVLFTESEVPELATRLLKEAGSRKVWLLEGDPGSGKTTLVRELVRQLGSSDLVQSPTFSILHEYHAGEQIIYHLDLYRINSLEEAFEAGVMECLRGTAYTFIEWPGLLLPVLEPDFFRIKLGAAPPTGQNNQREILW